MTLIFNFSILFCPRRAGLKRETRCSCATATESPTAPSARRCARGPLPPGKSPEPAVQALVVAAAARSCARSFTPRPRPSARATLPSWLRATVPSPPPNLALAVSRSASPWRPASRPGSPGNPRVVARPAIDATCDWCEAYAHATVASCRATPCCFDGVTDPVTKRTPNP